MTKKMLQQLVLESYNDETIDDAFTDSVADKLNRKELKQYVKALLAHEKKKTVVVSLPYAPSQTEQDAFHTLFPKQKIVYNVDDSLSLGVKVVNNDTVYDLTLQHTLDKLVSYIENNYD
jgi:F0F1-type ATP synthase delta subunit